MRAGTPNAGPARSHCSDTGEQHHMRDIEIIGAPVDLGAGRRGVDMGPSAIRIADLESRLEALGHRVTDSGDIDVPIPETQEVGASSLRFKPAILAACDALRIQVERIYA